MRDYKKDALKALYLINSINKILDEVTAKHLLATGVKHDTKNKI